jgi:hypothetical protein
MSLLDGSSPSRSLLELLLQGLQGRCIVTFNQLGDLMGSVRVGRVGRVGC